MKDASKNNLNYGIKYFETSAPDIFEASAEQLYYFKTFIGKHEIEVERGDAVYFFSDDLQTAFVKRGELQDRIETLRDRRSRLYAAGRFVFIIRNDRSAVYQRLFDKADFSADSRGRSDFAVSLYAAAQPRTGTSYSFDCESCSSFKRSRQKRRRFGRFDIDTRTKTGNGLHFRSDVSASF